MDSNNADKQYTAKQLRMLHSKLPTYSKTATCDLEEKKSILQKGEN
jgi:hypothetical protein